MKVLVIGGGGFIGSHVADMLVEQGHQVRVFGRSISDYNRSVDWVVGDFLDSSKLAEALVDIDVVVHSLSTMVPATSALAPEEDVKSNLLGTLKLLELMKRRGIARLVYLSSGGTVYGDPAYNPVPENAALKPISSYGAVKVSVEAFIGVAEAEWGLKSVIIRPSNPYGERQGGKLAQGLISNLLRCAIQKQPITIFGEGETIRDYIYVKDIAALIAASVDSSMCGIYNAGSGVGHCVSEVVSVVEQETAYIFEKKYVPARSFDVKQVVLDCAKAQADFNWTSANSLELGVARQYEYMKSLGVH